MALYNCTVHIACSIALQSFACITGTFTVFVQGAESELLYRFYTLGFFFLLQVLTKKLFLESASTVLFLLSSTFLATSASKEINEQRG